MAKRGVNLVILMGTLGADPEVRYASNGNAIANLRLATSETWKDQQTGQQNERTEWHQIVLFGKTAEIAGQYLKKGSRAHITGSLRTRKWTDKNGQDRYSTEIVGDELQFVDRASGQNSGYQNDGNRARPGSGQAQGLNNFDDDIPF